MIAFRLFIGGTVAILPTCRALRDKLLKGLQVCFLPGLIPVSVSTETPGTRYRFRASRSANRRISRLSFIFSTWLSLAIAWQASNARGLAPTMGP